MEYLKSKIIYNLSKHLVIEKSTGKEIIIPPGYIFDYANDFEGIYSLKSAENYKVFRREIEIIYHPFVR